MRGNGQRESIPELFARIRDGRPGIRLQRVELRLPRRKTGDQLLEFLAIQRRNMLRSRVRCLAKVIENLQQIRDPIRKRT
jgi:hypothetical protein